MGKFDPTLGLLKFSRNTQYNRLEDPVVIAVWRTVNETPEFSGASQFGVGRHVLV